MNIQSGICVVLILASVCLFKLNAADDETSVLAEVNQRPRPLVSLTLQQVEEERKRVLEQQQKNTNDRVRRANGRPYLPRPTPRPNH